MFPTTTPAFSSSPPQTKPSAAPVPTTPTTSASLLNCSANNGHVSVGTIPVMAKARIGHFIEAQILEAISIDYVDESEVLTPADDAHHINKHNFRVPFVCGCRDLGEALHHIREGAAMIRTKGEAGTSNIIEAVRHVRSVMGDIRSLRNMDDDEVFTFAKRIAAPYDLVMQTKQLGRIPVIHFAAGGVATPADVALMMQLGCDGVFIGSDIFKSGNPARRARAIVQAVTHYSNPDILANVSCSLGEAMVGINLNGDAKVETPRGTHPLTATPLSPTLHSISSTAAASLITHKNGTLESSRPISISLICAVRNRDRLSKHT